MIDNGKYRVAVVDDEPMVTQSIRNFLALETDYEILVFNSPREAISALKSTPVDLVISDYLMPELNGIEFFLQLKELQPQATRIDRKSVV